MGLDNYWVKPGEQDVCQLGTEHHVCGGMFSGNGNGSFRGKVYDRLVEDITDVSLYTDRISNEQVREMAKKLAETQFDPKWDIEEVEWNGLVAMFQEYSEAGCDLVAWY